MSEWNFDISTCPKGSNLKESREVGGRVADIMCFRPFYVWAAGDCGVVTKSYIENGGDKFSMFSKDHPPIAWQPFNKPKHPHKD